MKGLSNTLLICFIAILLIIPIGIGAWVGVSDFEQEINGGSSQNEETEIGLTLSETDVAFNIGATRKLTAQTDVEAESYIFQWNSSDKKVATVKKDADSQKACVVTAVGEGTATVTVSIIDKTQFKIVDSVTCSITVIDSSISFSTDEVIISLDESNTATVTASAPDNGEITWSSEDESIATVSDGVITAHKAGRVYIVAKSGNVEGKLLVVIYNSLFKLEPIKIVGAGSSAQISVTGQIGEGAKWTSADENIATVDENGVVTGVKLGITTIEVRSTTDDLTSSCVVIVKEGSAEVVELDSGKKAEAASNPGKWYYLCESNLVTIGAVPTVDNGVISLDITHVGKEDGSLSGANFFYLRYQPDAVGDIIYKQVLYIYAENEAILQINGKEQTYPAGLNRIQAEYTSSSPKDANPYQIKFKSSGKFYIIPVFEEVSRIEKMTLSEGFKTLNTGSNRTFTLTATVPNQSNPDIEWISSNETVATVKNGVVTAISEGSTIITAVCGNYSATCLVTVEGETPISGEKLSSGNKTATLASPGKWFYFADGKSKLYSTPIMDGDGNIHLSVESIDTANKKYVYLRYQPQKTATYKATITIEFAGTDGSVVDITGGNQKNATAMSLVNGTNTIEFTFTSDSAAPLQLKVKAVGNYVVNVELSEVK